MVFSKTCEFSKVIVAGIWAGVGDAVGGIDGEVELGGEF